MKRFFDLFKIFKNRQGFTLVELMVSAGILGGMTLAFMQLTKNTITSTKRVETRVGYRNVVNTITLMMLNQNACEYTMGIDAEGLGFVPGPALMVGDNVPFIRSGGGTGTAPLNMYAIHIPGDNSTLYENRTVSVKRMQVMQQLDGAGVPIPLPGSGSGNNAVLLNLEVDLNEEAMLLKEGTSGSGSGSADRIKTFRIPFIATIDTNDSNRIVSCASVGQDQFLAATCVSLGGEWDPFRVAPLPRCNISDRSAQYACESLRGAYVVDATGSGSGNFDPSTGGATSVPLTGMPGEFCNISAVTNEFACNYFGGNRLNNGTAQFQSADTSRGRTSTDERCSLEGHDEMRRMACRLAGGQYTEGAPGTCISSFEGSCAALGGQVGAGMNVNVTSANASSYTCTFPCGGTGTVSLMSGSGNNFQCNQRFCETDLAGVWNATTRTCQAQDKVAQIACQTVGGSYTLGGTAGNTGYGAPRCNWPDGKEACEGLSGTFVDNPGIGVQDYCQWNGAGGNMQFEDHVRRLACAQMGVNISGSGGGSGAIQTWFANGIGTSTTYVIGSYDDAANTCRMSLVTGFITKAAADGLYVTNQAPANGTIAIGGMTDCGGTNSVCIGYNASANNSNNAVVLGSYAEVDTSQSVSIGMKAISHANETVVMGYDSLANTGHHNSVGIGTQVDLNYRSVGIGYQAQAIGSSSIAIGEAANAATSNNIAIGTWSQTDDYNNISIGNNSYSRESWSIAIGTNANANDPGSDSVAAVAIGNDTYATGDNSVAVGDICSASGNHSIAMGATSDASGTRSMAIGYSSYAASTDSLAIGYNAYASGSNATTVGESSSAEGASSTAFGANANVTVSYGTAVGVAADVWGTGATTLGYDCNTGVANRIRLCSSTYSIYTDGPSWTMSSSRKLKTDFKLLNEDDFIDKIMELPLYSYRLKKQDPNNTQIYYGPVSEEYQDIFQDGGERDSIAYNNLWVSHLMFSRHMFKEQAKLQDRINLLEEENKKMVEQLAEIRKEIEALKRK